MTRDRSGGLDRRERTERSGAYILNFRETVEMRCFHATGWDLLYIFLTYVDGFSVGARER